MQPLLWWQQTNGVIVGVDSSHNVVICKNDASVAVLFTVTDVEALRYQLDSARIMQRVHQETQT